MAPVDNGEIGWIDRAATVPPSLDGLSLEEGRQARDAWKYHHFPVTRNEDPSSETIGYLVPAYGWALSVETMSAPGFDLQARIDEMDAERQRYIDKIQPDIPDPES